MLESDGLRNAYFSSYPNIQKARESSSRKIKSLVRSLPTIVDGVSVVANGSLARQELTSQSDFDAFPLYDRGRRFEAEALFEDVQLRSGLKAFAEEGAFGSPVPSWTMAKRIGGQGDDNRRFTRRMLLLLESVPLGPRGTYDAALDRVIGRYINDDITSKQIGRFLLNDVIRFYRTMCVDFEFKTIELPKPKPWGIRYTKLIFARKLTYFSGLLMCGALAGLPAAAKRARLRQMVELSPIDRIVSEMDDGVSDALKEYDSYLGLLDDPEIRTALGEVEMLRATHSEEFRAVKDSGRKFSSALVQAFRRKYPETHPIREAVLV
jgi:hypothetical protein